jgi:hypothetical protein
MWERFKRIDIYGQRIELTYKRERTFQTLCGACATLIITTGLFAVMAMGTIQVFNHQPHRLD